VKSLDGVVLQDDETVLIGEKVKAVLKRDRSVLLALTEADAQTGAPVWRTCSKEQLRVYYQLGHGLSADPDHPSPDRVIDSQTR